MRNLLIGRCHTIDCLFFLLHIEFTSQLHFAFNSNTNSSDLTRRNNEAIYRNELNSKDHILIGGLFPIHRKGNGKNNCGSVNVQRGIQRLEAMFFAVDEINANPGMLRNLPIQVNVFDTCDHDTFALEGAVKTILKKANKNARECTSNQPITLGVAGIVGASLSSVSIEVANLLRLFQVPQISYASTSSLLNDRTKYKYFLRTLPPNSEQAKAVIAIASALAWTAVSVLYSEGVYGETAFEAFEAASKDALCLVEKIKLNAQTNFTNVVFKLDKHQTARTVILFCDESHIIELLTVVHQTSVKNITWFSAEGWDLGQVLKTPNLRNVAESLLVLPPAPSWLSSKFVQYFYGLTLKNNKRNPWFKEYWKLQFPCSFENSSCENNVRDEDIFFDKKLPYVTDAVYALANAVDLIYKDYCPKQDGFCNEMRNVNSVELLDRIMNSTFPGVFGPTKFNNNGSVSHGYRLLRYRNRKFVKIGFWESDKLTLDHDGFLQPSFCSKPCSLGFIKKYQPNQPLCCYDCKTCGENQYADQQNVCRTCPIGSIPSFNMDKCVKLPELYLSRTWVISVSILAGIGVVMTVCASLLFFYYRHSEVVVASAPELSFPLLFGVLLCYILTFVMISDQTVTLCSLRRFGIGFCFSLCYGALLIKMNRLARVFSEYSSSNRAPRFITASSQLVLLLVVVTVQILLAFISFSLEETTVMAHMHHTGLGVIAICQIPMFDALSSYLYNLILVITCTVYAFHTRKVPACFNEAKYIGFVMYATLVVWVAFIPVYSIGVSAENAVIAICMNTSLNATTILGGMFGPKIYVILLRPVRNVRSFSTRSFSTSQSGAGDGTSVVSHKMTSYSLYDQVSRAGVRSVSLDEGCQFYVK